MDTNRSTGGQFQSKNGESENKGNGKTGNQIRYGVKPKPFIAACMKAHKDGGGTAQEVADILGIPKKAVTSRAANFRKKDIPLPNFKKTGGAKLDYEDLTAYAKSLA